MTLANLRKEENDKGKFHSLLLKPASRSKVKGNAKGSIIAGGY